MKLKRGDETVEVKGPDDPMLATYVSIGFELPEGMAAASVAELPPTPAEGKAAAKAKRK